MSLHKLPEPDYAAQPDWEAYYKCLPVEYRQSIEEGKDVAPYQKLFEAVAALPDGHDKAELADVLYRMVENAPTVAGYAYDEPSDLAEIRAKSAGTGEKLAVPARDVLEERIRGAWYGRICGCLLGKPIEGIRYDELTAFLRRSSNCPMQRYITHSDAMAYGDNMGFPLRERAYADGVMDGMPVDDDTNYIVLAMKVVREHGRDFTPADMMDVWMESQCKNAYCTAERVAYRNFVNGFRPPESARYKNPYREWIGAQIRGDFFGWINPGDPAAASDMAWRDASISHVKNGIYGEMWVAAMLACAAAGQSVEQCIRSGLDYIPTASRLHEAVANVISAHDAGMTAESFFADLHTRWNDRNGHDWCHTISNAEIVAAALLWGEGDYGKTVCLAVEQGFDTDCNGATAGSVVGMALGFDRIGRQWTDKVNGTLFTSIHNYMTLDIDRMARETMELL